MCEMCEKRNAWKPDLTPCADPDAPPCADPDAPNDSFEATVSAKLRDPMRAVRYILYAIVPTQFATLLSRIRTHAKPSLACPPDA